jgi:16S rRNA (cytosine1402-N4)-methyltransferase
MDPIFVAVLIMHTPVFLEKVLSHIHTPQDTRYIDCTLGEGGHTRAIAGMGLKVLAIDADLSQIQVLALSQEEKSKIAVVEGNYAELASIARTHGFMHCDGVLFDLGLSMRQLREGEGFSYKHLHQPLDMIIDTVAKQRGAARAADVVASYTYDELKAVFERYGERIHAGKIAAAIVAARSEKAIQTVGDFMRAIGKVTSQHDLPAVFQAIRIEVNQEFEKIVEGLKGATEVVRIGGTIQIITFHSGEDRIVKLWAKKLGLHLVAKYVGKAMSKDTFERSAILRVYERR